VVTGDITQIDLPGDKSSGLVEVARVLDGIEGIGLMRFTEADVVRHPLVQSILRAYDKEDRRRSEARDAGSEAQG
jgi:phosphate starvation-inducible PhoH-like protein